MATFTNLLSSPYSALFSQNKLRLHNHPLPSSPFFHSQLKSDWGCGRRVLVRVKGLNEPSRDDVESEPAMVSSGSLIGSRISSYSWCAGLGGLGFLETSYLTYLKVTGSDAFCPVGGGSCGDILNSGYAAVFGVPLPLIGMVAYGAAAFLALKLAAKDLPFGIDERNGGLILLGTTTSMATASAYLLYILNTQFSGASCSYCLVSVLLSFSLFFTTAKSLGWQKIREEVGLQLCVAGLVFAALSNSYSASALPPPTRFGEKFMPYAPTEIKAPSSPLALKLAAHLHSVGAKMYGAFWCSHCLEQKEGINALEPNIAYDAVTFSAAASTRVSNEMGAGKTKRAKQAMIVTVKLAVVVVLVIVMVLGFAHDFWAGLFSDSRVIINEYASMTPLLMISIMVDSIQGVLSGVARGCGWQHVTVYINLAMFYLIGMPVAALLAFLLKLNAKGLWIGLITGLLGQTGGLLLLVYFKRWKGVELGGSNDLP